MLFTAFILLILIIIFGYFFFSGRAKRSSLQKEVLEIDTRLLEENVSFYAGLDADKKKRFEEALLTFLHRVKITGVDTTVEELDKLLVASAAVIPIFYFRQWIYHNLREVLLYQDSMNMQFETSGNNERNILGLVGTGAFEGSMLLSKPALRAGFANTADKKNTAIHEFVHLIDKADGETDGIPDLLLDKQYVIPWLNLMHEKMQKIAERQSDIDDYAYTNKEEFLAVVAEYFFERPDLLEEKHPRLYQMLKEMFDTP